MRDMVTDLTPALVFGPVVLSADNTPAAIDLQGFDAAMVEIAVGIGGITFDSTNKIEFVLTHSDDNSSYSNVTATDIAGGDSPATVTGGIIKALTAAHAAAAVYRFGYVGNKRYLKLLADFSGTHGAGTPLKATVWKGNAWLKPPV